jgi:ADP-heptose:LPS heptosyltransferase
MATGMARGAKARGKRIAFGDGQIIRWDQFSRTIFWRNENIAVPGEERANNIEWIQFYKGKRIYNAHDGNYWRWNYNFRAKPGELFFSDEELNFAGQIAKGSVVVIEPNVPALKSVAPNKQWPVDRYQETATRLSAEGIRVVQLVHRGAAVRLKSASMISTPTIRLALAMLSRAALYIGPEGGLHHGAAALGISATVLFGGFIPPAVTGYDTHTNLTGNAGEACGSLQVCEHCRKAMESISVEEVVAASMRHLNKLVAA